MQRVILTILIFLVATKIESQNWVWAKSGYGPDGVNSGICTDPQGNVFVTGYFGGTYLAFGSDTLRKANAGYGYTIFLAKYDPNGNVLWATQAASGKNVDQPLSVSADPLGNVYITGYFSSQTITFGTKTLTNSSNFNIFLVKYDPNGNVIWAKNPLGSGGDRGFSVSNDIFGNVFLTGCFLNDSISFDGIVLANQGYADAFVAKYDSSGNAQWAKNIGGGNDDFGSSVSADPYGNVFVTGEFSSPTVLLDTILLTNSTTSGCTYGQCPDVFIAKYDTHGNVLWAKAAGVPGDDGGRAISSDLYGNAFVSGYCGSPITFGNTTLTNSGMFVAKYDSAGNALWAKGATGGTPYSLATNNSGDAYVTGGFLNKMNFGYDTLYPPPGSLDVMFLVKMTSNGEVSCRSALASGGNTNGVCVDRNGNVYVGSTFQVNPFVIGLDTLHKIGYEDVFVAKYDCKEMATEVVHVKKRDLISVYPNPTNEFITVNFEEVADHVAIRIYDLIGNAIVSCSYENTSTLKIDLSKHSKGVYVMEVALPGQKVIKKIFLQ